jgi:hypothetical protein
MGSWIIKTGYKSWIWRAAPRSAYEISEYIQTWNADHIENAARNRKRRSGEGQAGSTADVELIVDVWPWQHGVDGRACFRWYAEHVCRWMDEGMKRTNVLHGHPVSAES